MKSSIYRVLRLVVTIFRVSRKFRMGLILLSLLIAVGLASLEAPPWAESWYRLPGDSPPKFTTDLTYILGTSTNGRSVFWSLSRGVLNSMIIGIITALIASHIGLMIGMIAGYSGGSIDRVLTFITDVFIIIPHFPLYVLILMFLKKYMTIPLIGFVLAITAWCGPARQVRAMVLSLREREFILVSRLSGLNTIQIVFKEIILHLLGWHFINFTNTVIYAIGSETGLAILGLSILEKDTLGTIIYWAQNYGALYRGILWWILPPVIVLVIIFTALFLVSLGLSEYLNPRTKSATF